MRLAASAAVVLLLVAALLAGNCLSCPQVLVGLASHQAAHGCCHPGGKHTQTAKCHTQAMGHFVKADAGTQVSLGVAVAAVVPPAVLPVAAIERSASAVVAVHASPVQIPIRI